MAIDLIAQTLAQRAGFRHAACGKRLRASRGGVLVCDTTDALLVWPPGHVVPQYAVPLAQLADRAAGLPEGSTPVDEPGFEDHVLLPFAEFDWLEEEESVIGHPHDPYARIDILHSTRHVRVERGGVLLAQTHHPVAVFETGLPTRWYLPTHDVRTDLLAASDTRSTCAYKGHASYLSLSLDPGLDPDGAGGAAGQGSDGRDIAWVYRHPLREAEAIRDHICFWAERTVTTVDGAPAPVLTGPRPAGV